MSERKVAHRYALAFYEEMSEKKKLKKVLDDMQMVRKTLEASSSLTYVLHNPALPSRKKLRILRDVFSKYVSKETVDYIDFLAMKKRVYLLRELAEQFQNIHRDSQGIVHLRVVMSPGLDKGFSKQLVSKLTKVTGHAFDSEIVVDPSLLGGFLYMYQGRVFDYSLKGGLHAMVRSFAVPLS